MAPLRDAVLAAAARPDVRTAIAGLYRDVQAQIDARRPLCAASGRCCHFERFGHRLYITTLELAAFLHDLKAANAPSPSPWDGAGCPFQAGRLCAVHSIRPFGCRIFFCDPTADAWQQEQYQRFHARLKDLHDELAVPYFYVEWRSALAQLGLAIAPTP